MKTESEFINIANLSPDFPIWVSGQEYDALNGGKRQGWSQCQTQKEWMVKLHYLRRGYKEGKIEKAAFFRKERDLVLNWWQKWL